jgi:predicted signal transduction protein with EAL and GGDEF domain
MSIGAVVCKGAVSHDALMKLADEALYMAKAAGRDTYRLLIKNRQDQELVEHIVPEQGQIGL